MSTMEIKVGSRVKIRGNNPLAKGTIVVSKDARGRTQWHMDNPPVAVCEVLSWRERNGSLCLKLKCDGGESIEVSIDRVIGLADDHIADAGKMVGEGGA